MLITNRPALSPEEKKLPLAKYHDLPLYPPGPRELQLIDTCPIDPHLAINAEDCIDLLQPTGYRAHDIDNLPSSLRKVGLSEATISLKDGSHFMVQLRCAPQHPEVLP
jgi:hypothetical protein